MSCVQNLVGGRRALGNAAKEFTKRIPASLFRIWLAWICSGRMVEFQTLVRENAGRQFACTRKTKFAEPLNLEVQVN